MILRRVLGDHVDRLLVVEDDPDTRELIVEWLTLQGYDVVGASSAEEALLALRGGARFDAMLTDYILPGDTGTELLRTAFAEGLLEPGQALMASATPPHAELAALGVEVMQKPVDLAHLVERIEAMLVARHAAEVDAVSSRSAVPPAPAVDLVLYVSKGSIASMRARRVVCRLVNKLGEERVRLAIRDVAEHPDAASEDRVKFTPTLLRIHPEPKVRLIGDLRDDTALRDMLDAPASSG